MTTSRSLRAPALTVDADALGYFRYGKIGDGFVITSDAGAWQHLRPERFRRFLSGGMTEDLIIVRAMLN